MVAKYQALESGANNVIAFPVRDVNSDLTRALNRMSARFSLYSHYSQYYDGKQPLTFQSDKYRSNFARMVSKYVENMCPIVVDAASDRLTVHGIEVEGGDTDAAGAALWNVWDREVMALRAQEIHTEAIKTGDAYLIVWPNPQGEAKFFVNRAERMTCFYAEDSDTIEMAAKWQFGDDGYSHVTLYYPDRFEYYISTNIVRIGAPDARTTYKQEMPSQRNPWGLVPVFHFANDALDMFGTSDLHDVCPIQDGLNKSVADMLVGMEFSAYNQRWAAGLEITEDPITGRKKPPFEPGQDRLWVSEDKDVKFGEFTATSLDNFINAHDMFVTSVARVSGTPIQYMLLDTSTFPSGEALKTAEARFVKRVVRKQHSFGAVWQRVMNFVAAIERISIPETTRVKIHWEDANPRSDYDSAQTAVLKKQVGVSDEQNMREMGYSEEEIAQMTKEKDDAAEADVKRQQAVFAAKGGAPNDDPKKA